MKKITIIIFIIIITIALSFTIYFLLSKENIESAIDEFEDQDYIESIQILNRLSLTSDYESSEKIYYYRCRAINKLADQIEKKYSDELIDASLDKKGSPGFEQAKKELEEYLIKINKKINGDLTLILSRKKSAIISRGKFYDEFIAKYKGSNLIEDLNFEEIQKISKSEPDKLLISLINYYNKYPNTNYISQIVKILFENLQNNKIDIKDKSEVLWDIIISYVKRYPTSPEMNKLYQCKGDNVNLRNSPGVEGNMVGKIKKDEILIQLEKSMDTSQIGDARDYWFRIVTLNGLKGWIFGKFITPLDTSKFQVNEKIKEKWTLEESFEEWDDSNTPKNWIHIPDSDKSGISFSVKGTKKFIILNSVKGKRSGLYSRYNASRAFKILSKARFISGDSIVLFAYVMGDGNVFYVRLKDEELDVSGRKIPIHTSDWHEYLFESEDGKYAKLYLDGEVISARIPAVPSITFKAKGIYCLYSPIEESGSGEMEYIKIR